MLCDPGKVGGHVFLDGRRPFRDDTPLGVRVRIESVLSDKRQAELQWRYTAQLPPLTRMALPRLLI